MELKWASANDVGYLYCPQWENEGLFHGFLSGGIDSRTNANRCDFLVNAISKSSGEGVLRLKQVHSCDIISSLMLQSPSIDSKTIQGDGWFIHSRCPKAIYGIETADCAPVLIRATHKPIFAALHCGWKGTFGGILENCLTKFYAQAICADEIEILIGPCAGSCCYEVQGDFIRALSAHDIDQTLSYRNERTFFDLKHCLRLQAEESGILPGSISIAEECTICDLRFFSFRRQKAVAGRQLSFISTF